jgi:hypothetical protein
MNKKIIGIFVCMLVIVGNTIAVSASTFLEKPRSLPQNNGGQQGSTILICELYDNRVIEVDSSGTIVWQKTGLEGPVDAERLANGNTLIAELFGLRVIEIDTVGNIVWQYATGLDGPWDVERLSNGNTLITDFYSFRVIEVDTTGTIVWSRNTTGMPSDVEPLANGNTLLAEFEYANRVIEIDSSGAIVWEITGLSGPTDVERLSNGNTLISEYLPPRVIEVDSTGAIVWTYSSETGITFDAERYANSNTLISEIFYGNRVFEVDIGGNIIWQKTGLNIPTDAEIITAPPDAPTITGQTSGKPEIEYEYTFKAVDPNDDDIRYNINWGDGTTEITGFNSSGSDVKVKHTYSEKGTYNITAKAQDIYGAEGPEGKLEVTIPRKKPSNFKFNQFIWFFERFPNLFPILQLILDIN